MAKATGDLVWKVVESDEVDIETRRDAKSPAHRTTIWIVATEDGVYIRSFKGKRGRWYQEALANRNVTVSAGRRKVAARVQVPRNHSVISGVNAAYIEKYGKRWPDSARDVVRRARLNTTLRLEPLGLRRVSTGLTKHRS